MTDTICLECLDPEDIVPISRQTTEVFKTGTWSSIRPCFAEKISPCRAACPLGNNITGALKAGALGDFDDALAAFLEESPLPGVCGRVCYHPCQKECNRAELEGTVGIRALERAAADLGRAEVKSLSNAGEGKPVAVVGSGPAGLACAYHLARLGHPVTLFEASSQAGGLLARGIPGFRLPPQALNRDLERIWHLPINLRLESPVGPKDLNRLLDEHQAVFLGCGADVPHALKTPGENLEGVLTGLDFLRNPELQSLAQGTRVVVIGGGNTALDAARSALRAGAREVSILYRRTRELMPAFGEEIDQAEAEGVAIQELVAPISFLGDAGKVGAVRLTRLRLGQAEPGARPRPEPLDQTGHEFPCDLVLLATGHEPGNDSLLRELKWQGGRVWVDEWGQTSRPGLFAGGDITPARASVVDAMAGGKRAALGIHLSLVGEKDDDALQSIILGPGPAFSLTALFQPPKNWQADKVARPDPITLLLAPPDPPRRQPQTEPALRAGGDSEVIQGFTAGQAAEEAGRCFLCGSCVGCDNCYTFCPEGAVIPPVQLGYSYSVKDDFCKGCGLCASVCLRGVMEPGGDS